MESVSWPKNVIKLNKKMLFIKYFDCGVGDGFLACGSDEPWYWPMVSWVSIHS